MNDTTQLEKVRAEMVRRHENDLERAAQRIAELEAQLAHMNALAETYYEGWNNAVVCDYEPTKEALSNARESRARLVEFVRYRARELENADEFIRDIEAERDAAREETEQAQGHAVAYLHRANEAEQDAREMFDAIDAYLIEKKRLAYSAGYVLADETPDPNTLALSKLADMRIKHGAKYLKDGEQ